MKTRLEILAISAALALSACDSAQMGSRTASTPAPSAPQAVMAPKPAPVAPAPVAQAPVAPAPKVAAPAPAPVSSAQAPAAKPAPAVAASGKPKIRQPNADANDLPDPYPASYTLPSGEVLTIDNVQNPPPADGKLSNLAGTHMTLSDLPDKNKLATFAWDGFTRRVVLTPDTVVDFNGKLGTINDIDAAQARGAVVAYLSKNGVYAVMLRFGHGLLTVSSDSLNAKQVAALESIVPTPTGQSNVSFEKKASSITSSLNLNNPAKEKAVYDAILTQTEGVRNAHNAGFGPPKELHTEFNKELSSVLTPDQIDKVKDSLTGNKTPTTFKVYHQIVTDLNSNDDKVIMSFLKQAREDSLDVKNLEEMAPIYKTYKNQIEAYINAHGHDYKALYKTFVDGQKAATTKPAP